jgi:hypothetical protein
MSLSIQPGVVRRLHETSTSAGRHARTPKGNLMTKMIFVSRPFTDTDEHFLGAFWIDPAAVPQ